MTDIWFISDTHFNHNNILKFVDSKDQLIRGGFTDVNHMNETMINNWNAVIKPQDKVYHLGDIAFGKSKDMESILCRLNGHKRLILGNHDIFGMKTYLKYFDKITVNRTFTEFAKPFICTHYPIHKDSVGMTKHNKVWNVHGHIHQNKIRDTKYINVCVEHTDYKPVHLDELLKMMK